MTNPFYNPIGFLQELCQRHKAPHTFPMYIDIGGTGPDHCRKFSCKCVYESLEVIGTGNKKKHAKFEAAKMMYELLVKKNYFDKLNIQIKSENLEDTDSSSSVDTKVSAPKHAISALQEYCQAFKFPLPNYFETSSVSGFMCECAVLHHKTYGQGPNKKAAKTEAAQEMCNKLNISIPTQNVSKPEVDVEVPVYKNAISVLQEFASKRKKQAPEYEDKGFILGSFVIACGMGSMTAEGSDTTKKGAKIEAAHKLLETLIASEGVETRICYQAIHQTNASPPECSLEEFNLDSDEDEEKDSKESLSLDDRSAETTVKVKVEGNNTIVTGTSGKNDEKSENSDDKSNELSATENQDPGAEAAAKVPGEEDSTVVNGPSQQKDVDSENSENKINEGSHSMTENQDPIGEAAAQGTEEGDLIVVNGTSQQIDSTNSEHKVNEGSQSKTENKDDFEESSFQAEE